MNKPKITFENRIRYRNGEMSEKEKAEYEAETTSYPKVRKQIWIHEKAISELGKEHIRSQLETNWETMVDQSKPNWNKPTFRIGIAATVLLLFTCSWVLWPSSTPIHTELFNAHYETPLAGARNVNPAYDPTWKEAVEAYGQGGESGFEKAILLFGKYLSQSNHPEQKNHQARFHIGISFLELGRGDSARKHLGQINMLDPALYVDAKWYFAMSYLQEGNSLRTCSYFKAIAEDPAQSALRRQKASSICQKFNCN